LKITVNISTCAYDTGKKCITDFIKKQESRSMTFYPAGIAPLSLLVFKLWKFFLA